MLRIKKKIIFLAYFIALPWLSVASSSWLTFAEVGPCWPVLWLLPWAIEEGPMASIYLALCFGLVLDGFMVGDVTQLPILILLGFWWGQLGRRGVLIEGSFNLALLAFLGSVLFGLSVWIQILFLNRELPQHLLNLWGIHIVLAQAIITGLLAPLVCSFLLLLRRRTLL